MDDFIVLSCKSCGGRLEITSDLDRFACAYCGTEQIVNRRGGVVSLELVSEKLDGMKVGIDRTAAELAIIRLTNELQELHIQATTLFETISELKDTLTNASSQKCELEETVLLAKENVFLLQIVSLGWGCFNSHRHNFIGHFIQHFDDRTYKFA